MAEISGGKLARFIVHVFCLIVIDIINELVYDTTDTPHVSGDVVSVLNKRYLWRSIIACVNMCRHSSLLLSIFSHILISFDVSKSLDSRMNRNASVLDLLGNDLRHSSSQSEVADLNIQGQ